MWVWLVRLMLEHVNNVTESRFSLQATYTVNFIPEIVIVDSDSETGILTQNFTLTYSITSATQLQLNKSLGQVAIEDPFETVQVGCNMHVIGRHSTCRCCVHSNFIINKLLKVSLTYT